MWRDLKKRVLAVWRGIDTDSVFEIIFITTQIQGKKVTGCSWKKGGRGNVKNKKANQALQIQDKGGKILKSLYCSGQIIKTPTCDHEVFYNDLSTTIKVFLVFFLPRVTHYLGFGMPGVLSCFWKSNTIHHSLEKYENNGSHWCCFLTAAWPIQRAALHKVSRLGLYRHLLQAG